MSDQLNMVAHADASLRTVLRLLDAATPDKSVAERILLLRSADAWLHRAARQLGIARHDLDLLADSP